MVKLGKLVLPARIRNDSTCYCTRDDFSPTAYVSGLGSTVPPTMMVLGIIGYPPPLSGGLDLNSSNRGCARLGSKVAPPPLRLVKEEVAVLIVLPQPTNLV